MRHELRVISITAWFVVEEGLVISAACMMGLAGPGAATAVSHHEAVNSTVSPLDAGVSGSCMTEPVYGGRGISNPGPRMRSSEGVSEGGKHPDFFSQ